MLDIIQLLPDSIANQIAAGEVVQRPASIVKELLENSIDAHSTVIKLVLKDSGKTLVQVIDNGIGMSETDARMSFERHATSKISTTEDLFRIRTMGFRGEALASIAAVAQVEMKTKRESDDLGTFIRIEASKIKSQETISCTKGTSIAVKNLFFNVPARRNFLKSNPVEMRHILDEFQRVSLAHPEVEFSLLHNDLEIYQLNSGKLSQRITAVFGKNYQRQLAVCQEDTPLLKIKGYIGKPEFAKKTRGEQFFFVNNRFIKHAYLHHAVVSAYENLISSDTFPFYVLFLEIAPQHIDVNIHPTKTEIKFDDERSIYSIVQSAVRKALSVYNFTPSIDFESDVNFDLGSQKPYTIQENILYQGQGISKPQFNQKSTLEKNNLENWEKIYAHIAQNTPEEEKNSSTEQDEIFTFESNVNQSSDKLFLEDTKERNIFQLHQHYLIAQVKSGMLLIDQKSAFERILYEQYLGHLDKKSAVSQSLLFPVTLSFNPSDFQLFLEVEEEVKHLGFIFEILSEQQVLLKAVPSDMVQENESELLEELIEQVKLQQGALKLSRKIFVAQVLAKKIASRHSKLLTKSEANILIDKLFASTNPEYTPNGSKIFVVLDLDKIDSFFVRK